MKKPTLPLRETECKQLAVAALKMQKCLEKEWTRRQVAKMCPEMNLKSSKLRFPCHSRTGPRFGEPLSVCDPDPPNLGGFAPRLGRKGPFNDPVMLHDHCASRHHRVHKTSVTLMVFTMCEQISRFMSFCIHSAVFIPDRSLEGQIAVLPPCAQSEYKTGLRGAPKKNKNSRPRNPFPVYG